MSDYTIMRAADAPDYTGGDGPPFLGYARPMGAQQLAFNVRVLPPHSIHVPPGVDPARGHNHRTIEELYFVLDGDITIKLDDEVEKLGPRDAVLIPAGTVRQARNDGDTEAALAMVSVRVEDQRTESEWHDAFWPSP